MNLASRTGLFYFGTMGSYGFYRGYNGLYKDNLKKKLYEKQKNINHDNHNELYTNKFMQGIGGFLWQTNPIMFLFNLYGIVLRTEKKIRKIELTPDDYEY